MRIIFLIGLLLGGNATADVRQLSKHEYHIVCIEGYKYIYSHRRLAPKFNKARKPEKCYKKKEVKNVSSRNN